MRKLIHLIHGLENFLLVGLLSGMILLAVLQILLRNFFDAGILWAEPLLRVAVLWVGMLGALAATRDNRHINVDVLSRLLRPAQKVYLTIVSNLFAAAVTGAITYYSTVFVIAEYIAATPGFSTIPLWLLASILPFGFGLMTLRFIAHGIACLNDLGRKGASS